MTALNNQQKQLLFDYCLGLVSPEEAAEAESLIASGEEAAGIHARIKSSLVPLEALETEPCPDELVEGTIWRVNNVVRSSQLKLEQLLADEQARGRAGRSQLWNNLSKAAAVAAVILIGLAAWHPTLNAARQRYWRQRCQAQLGQVFQGFRNYISDHDGQMPAVPTAAGAPWWWGTRRTGWRRPGRESSGTTRSANTA